MSTGEKWVYWNHETVAKSAGVLTTYGDGEGGFQVNHIQKWKEYEISTTGQHENFKNWQETMGYSSWQELLEDKDAVCTYSPVWFVYTYLNAELAKADDAIALAAQSCLNALQDYSWKMLVAPTEEEFNKLWAEMKETVEGYGIADVQSYFTSVYDKCMEQVIADGYGPEGDMIVNWDELVSPWHK